MAPNKFTRKERFGRILQRIPLEARNELRDALTRAAEVVNETQRSYVPVEDGTLRQSIRHDPVNESEGKIAVAIRAGGRTTTRPVRDGASVTYDYAMAQEFGTKEMRANPFFFPGYRVNRKRVRSRVTRAVKKAARRAADV
ncbi:HK97 gp10 family phage protein [Aureimonas altamirensis]|uniref:HK97-gp10 family putative phage morphogenesis protein n=1 Tax=Aureimonas altamirensis TaxID=370622 RepID=UPI001E29B896|nr:HK97-gp10 family putative phage morphogenesis protein [Aureimonas altamirensis]UHD44914.1 HK97 gp10 family phage protein [Aureimonas altamirensis]